jgi:hypothetical protein
MLAVFFLSMNEGWRALFEIGKCFFAFAFLYLVGQAEKKIK